MAVAKKEVVFGPWRGVLYPDEGKNLSSGRVQGNLRKGYDFVALTYSEKLDLTKGWSRRMSYHKGYVGRVTYGTVFYTRNQDLKRLLAQVRYRHYGGCPGPETENFFRQDGQYGVSTFCSFSRDYQDLVRQIIQMFPELQTPAAGQTEQASTATTEA